MLRTQCTENKQPQQRLTHALSSRTINAQPCLSALAHKHAHHLHSIPPREKSTRTLIIDHMLWVHGKTRFAQARAELGMTDRTGGPSSRNYAYRDRPENYIEDEDAVSSGEDSGNLRVISREFRNLHTHPAARDLALATTLRNRADSLEKVVVAMLVQTPPDHLTENDSILTPPNSPGPESLIPRPHPHTLPNGVRVRLALGTLINDLFAPNTIFPHPYLFQSPSNFPLHRNHDTYSCVPTVSQAYPQVVASYHDISLPDSVALVGKQHLVPGPHVRALYDAGAALGIGCSPATFCCNRHLNTNCEICAPASAFCPSYGRSSTFPSSSMNSTYQASNPWKGMPGGVGPGGGGISGWLDGSGIGSGLSRNGAIGNVLRQCADQWNSSIYTGTSNTGLPGPIHRFLRLSALVAVELSMEAMDEEEMKSKHHGRFTPPVSPIMTTSVIYGLQERPLDAAFLPTQQWYMLLAGLLTRSVLEGYLVGYWKGVYPLEYLLTIGLRAVDEQVKDRPQDPFEEFNPDGLPTLSEAINLLFFSPVQEKSSAQQRYETEMWERLRMFYESPPTALLRTHLTDLSDKFPAEPVERAAVRFCEAISEWRGKPELERSKRPATTNTYNVASTQSVGPPFPQKFVNSSSLQKGKSSIDVYFVPPGVDSIGETISCHNKRPRAVDDSGLSLSKRIHRS